MLERLGIHALRVFEAEIKAGASNGLAKDEPTELFVDAEDAEAPSAKGKGKARTETKGVATIGPNKLGLYGNRSAST
ncbi:uncharacterized protein PHACADRAFT_261109 [Phanerochaete carnosa HHB-10118-sp]|uniref:Uncharacterized protein n=1 Tax=Phanerochaete carnosa (strain HHB-10118-sp) TaxID=650164 RepID=K5W118_PHACS|nr:uncharacterized protein PHACADRAFT_261109 [Phanerochaete carnosa HHB-10118-sp]EKM52589.1 hypothetical protein PHACADRAFT_261109 [Phanerochaete carnosa HHB-10118-sp]